MVIQLQNSCWLLLTESRITCSDNCFAIGDAETVNTLEKRSDSFNVSEYWSTHENRLATVAYKARAAKRPPSTLKGTEEDGSATVSGESGELAYPHEGDPLWYQPSETVSEFLKRCPPDTTVLEESGIDWFWVDNPHQSAHPKHDPDIQALIDSGSRLLEDYRKKREDLEKKNPSMRKGAITSKLIKDREKLKQQIAGLARETHVVCGKVTTIQPKPHVHANLQPSGCSFPPGTTYRGFGSKSAWLCLQTGSVTPRRCRPKA